MEVPIKIPASYFVEIDKPILKLYMERQKTQSSQHTIEEDDRGLTLCNLKTYFKAPVMKTVWY